MVSLRDFTVVVKADGKPLEEYLPGEEEDDEPHTVTRYVESSPGQAFAIAGQYNKTKLPGFPEAKGVTYLPVIDGIACTGIVSGTSHPFATTYSTVETHTKDGWKSQPLEFSDINIVDENGLEDAASLRDLKQTLTDLGSIVIKIRRYRSRKLERRPCRSGKGNEKFSQSHVSSIPEKALKGDSKTHRIHLGPSTLMEGEQWCGICDDIDSQSKPYATFIFKYRSKESLQVLGIIPRPIPLEERLASELSREELLLRLERQESRLQSESHVKENRPQEIKIETGQKRKAHDGDDDSLQLVRAQRVKQHSGDPIVIDDD